MKRKLISILLTVLCIFYCTQNAIAIDYYIEDNTQNYEEILNSYSNTDIISKSDFFNFIFSLNNIDINLTNRFTFKTSYTINSVGFNTNVTRTTALIDIMRSFMLIPNPKYTNHYDWSDTPSNFSDQDIAYINYAKELGITNGLTNTEFGFYEYVTIWQLKEFINRINRLDLENNKTIAQITITTCDEIGNLGELAKPLVIEYLYTLPDNIINSLIKNNWEIIMCGDIIPGYDDTSVVGATYPYKQKVYLTTIGEYSWTKSFKETMIHEFGHVIHTLYNLTPIPEDILSTEKPKLAKDYRPYADSSDEEFIACAWAYLYYKNDDYFSKEYPKTYQFIQNMISEIK